VNPSGRSGAPETDPGPSGVGRRVDAALMGIPFHKPDGLRAGSCRGRFDWQRLAAVGALGEEAVVTALDLPLDTVVGHVLHHQRPGVTVAPTLGLARMNRHHPRRVIPDGDLRQRSGSIPLLT
jgi:hypothetical protein